MYMQCICRCSVRCSKLWLCVSPTETDSGYASLPPTSLSQDSYELLPPPRPTLESSVSMEYPSQAEGRDEADGSGMSRSLDRRLL